jgi:hypothetical protein
MNVYNQKVLVANWYEEAVLQEDKIKNFMERREKGELTSQKNVSLSTAMLKPTTLSKSEDGFVRIGDATVIANFAGDNEKSLTFAGKVAAATDNVSPQLRNTFIVFGTDGSKPGDYLRYNQSFAIATHPQLSDQPNFMDSDVSGLLNTKKSRTQPLGFTEQACFGATWKVLCFDPQLRLESEGMPVPANQPVIIVHCKTNNNLTYLPNYSQPTPFGKGLEMTARTELDSHNAEQGTNHWTFVLS